MIKLDAKFKDFNGNERSIPCYFNLMETEVVDLQTMFPGGLIAYINKIMTGEDPIMLVPLFKELILTAYGEPDSDGIHFNKSPELRARFANSLAYTAIWKKLSSDDEAAATFINGIIPNAEPVDMAEAMKSLPAHLRPVENN